MLTRDAGKLLEISDIKLHFGGVYALGGAGFSVPSGAILGLIGPNGAGKTTLFNVISGFLRPESGCVRFDGQDISGWSPDQITRAGLLRTFQIARGLPSLTVLENLMLYGAEQPGENVWRAILRPSSVARRESALLEDAWRMLQRLELEDVANNLASELSGGQKKLIELGRALMRKPKMVLLDEPAAGVNPGLARRLVAHIRAWQADGTTFLIVEHNMGLIAELCDEVVVMSEGRRLLQGSFAEAREDHRVLSAYLGSRA
jgi:ABC-type branched-subunit amino acid transport system ATPase component